MQTSLSYLVSFVGLGCMLFVYPLLSVFSHAVLVWGIPLLYLYLFLLWLGFIVVIAWVMYKMPAGDA
ncbi:hypothetical protein BegalDRAFT_2339 [Beggiatoa alba B18LD]|uniref:DUF3311 domain-containing protein n=1 Tax=Beggiatoa alba B18LD TaxID=395493 RepID=I3CHV0_9GAMM|nr:hypothetical protein [Beggiatoa alba]EIJ43193.1 hypothetical protein BegalDRAFT_2339 [Beggiatoa alba B18LD]